MSGSFICVDSYGTVTVHPTRQGGVVGQPPTPEDISESYMPIQMADRVLFIGKDTSVWLIKDRGCEAPKLLFGAYHAN